MMPITDIHHFDYSIFRKMKNASRKAGNPGTRKKKYYKDIICAFDIETTNLDEETAFMYVWQFQVGDICTVVGRTWEEYLTFLHAIADELRRDTYVVIYVHNLGFEFSFLKGIYPFSEDEVFATDLRKVLKCEMLEHFEYRCSYLQSNMSLEEFAKKWGKTRKYSGRFDYSKIRYPWTPLTRKERKYIQNDVISLVEAMENRMASDNDNLYSIPLTSTGYVRREAKRRMKGYNHIQLMALMPDAEVMEMLLEAFRGGNTHANRYMTLGIWENVHSWDISSSYPGSQVTELFPMSPWYKFEDPRNLTIDKLVDELSRDRALLIRFAVSDFRMRNPLDGCPYVPRHKTRHLINPIIDNGRVLAADYFEMTVTDIDLRIILKQADFSAFKVLKMANSVYGQLPEMLTDYTKELFRLKTELKGGDELQYMLSKERINSIYGMSVQNPIRPDIKYINGEFLEVVTDFRERVEKANKRAFQSYAWGVWVTAWSRLKLQKAIDLIGQDRSGDGFIYCDTDSVKFVGNTDIDSLNKELIEKAKSVGAYATDPKGNVHYMGVWEKEPDYDEFVTLGAKRYAYMQNGKLGITVAGVSKKAGAEELASRGGLKAFNDGFIFRNSGKISAYYHDNVDEWIYQEGKRLHITDNVVLKETEYTMGLTGDYLQILEHPALWLDMLREN